MQFNEVVQQPTRCLVIVITQEKLRGVEVVNVVNRVRTLCGWCGWCVLKWVCAYRPGVLLIGRFKRTDGVNLAIELQGRDERPVALDHNEPTVVRRRRADAQRVDAIERLGAHCGSVLPLGIARELPVLPNLRDTNQPLLELRLCRTV